MMILEYPLQDIEEQILTLTKDCVILSPQSQGGKLFLVASVNPDAPPVNRKILIANTNSPLWFSIYKTTYLGTVQQGTTDKHIFDGGVV